MSRDELEKSSVIPTYAFLREIESDVSTVEGDVANVPNAETVSIVTVFAEVLSTVRVKISSSLTKENGVTPNVGFGAWISGVNENVTPLVKELVIVC